VPGLKGVIDSAKRAVQESLLARRLLILCWYGLGAAIAYAAAFQLRFDGAVPLAYQVVFWQTLPLLIAVFLVTFAVFRLYSGMWSYFGVDDLARLAIGLVTATAFFAAGTVLVRGALAAAVPRSVIAAEFLLLGVWTTASRFAARYARERGWFGESGPTTNRERILIVGRIDDADLAIRSIRGCRLGDVVGLITGQDRDRGHTLHRVPILGALADVAQVARSARADSVLVLPPFNKPAEMNRIVGACADAGQAVAFRTVPSLADLAMGDLEASSIREVAIEDLLGRGPARLDCSEVRSFLKGKRVMITGAGGSIGAELARQVAGYEPEMLVLFEFSEFALYSIDMDLRRHYPSLPMIPVAGDVRHAEEIRAAISAAGGVDVVYHAAAYKHVPLMEINVPACFRTNVLGTVRLAQVAAECGVDRFVMISSDKAVRPTSIMGATKRIAERAIAEIPQDDTSFVSVRFGNVLDSSGSVIPVFRRQIAAGGPVTVTSPGVRRFFMTIPEAVDLVLAAGTVGRNGDIMVLEMGESIRIAELAERLVELSGFVPGKDIAVEYVGLRPGEKECEEVMTEDENVVRTASDRIWVMTKKDGHSPPSLDISRIEDAVCKHDEQMLRALATEYVPENHFKEMR